MKGLLTKPTALLTARGRKQLKASLAPIRSRRRKPLLTPPHMQAVQDGQHGLTAPRGTVVKARFPETEPSRLSYLPEKEPETTVPDYQYPKRPWEAPFRGMGQHRDRSPRKKSLLVPSPDSTPSRPRTGLVTLPGVDPQPRDELTTPPQTWQSAKPKKQLVPPTSVMPRDPRIVSPKPTPVVGLDGAPPEPPPPLGTHRQPRSKEPGWKVGRTEGKQRPVPIGGTPVIGTDRSSPPPTTTPKGRTEPEWLARRRATGPARGVEQRTWKTWQEQTAHTKATQKSVLAELLSKRAPTKSHDELPPPTRPSDGPKVVKSSIPMPEGHTGPLVKVAPKLKTDRELGRDLVYDLERTRTDVDTPKLPSRSEWVAQKKRSKALTGTPHTLPPHHGQQLAPLPVPGKPGAPPRIGEHRSPSPQDGGSTPKLPDPTPELPDPTPELPGPTPKRDAPPETPTSGPQQPPVLPPQGQQLGPPPQPSTGKPLTPTGPKWTVTSPSTEVRTTPFVLGSPLGGGLLGSKSPLTPDVSPLSGLGTPGPKMSPRPVETEHIGVPETTGGPQGLHFTSIAQSIAQPGDPEAPTGRFGLPVNRRRMLGGKVRGKVHGEQKRSLFQKFKDKYIGNLRSDRARSELGRKETRVRAKVQRKRQVAIKTIEFEAELVERDLVTSLHTQGRHEEAEQIQAQIEKKRDDLLKKLDEVEDVTHDDTRDWVHGTIESGKKPGKSPMMGVRDQIERIDESVKQHGPSLFVDPTLAKQLDSGGRVSLEHPPPQGERPTGDQPTLAKRDRLDEDEDELDDEDEWEDIEGPPLPDGLGKPESLLSGGTLTKVKGVTEMSTVGLPESQTDTFTPRPITGRVPKWIDDDRLEEWQENREDRRKGGVSWSSGSVLAQRRKTGERLAREREEARASGKKVARWASKAAKGGGGMNETRQLTILAALQSVQDGKEAENRPPRLTSKQREDLIQWWQALPRREASDLLNKAPKFLKLGSADRGKLLKWQDTLAKGGHDVDKIKLDDDDGDDLDGGRLTVPESVLSGQGKSGTAVIREDQVGLPGTDVGQLGQGVDGTTTGTTGGSMPPSSTQRIHGPTQGPPGSQGPTSIRGSTDMVTLGDDGAPQPSTGTGARTLRAEVPRKTAEALRRRTRPIQRDGTAGKITKLSGGLIDGAAAKRMSDALKKKLFKEPTAKERKEKLGKEAGRLGDAQLLDLLTELVEGSPEARMLFREIEVEMNELRRIHRLRNA